MAMLSFRVRAVLGTVAVLIAAIGTWRVSQAIDDRSAEIPPPNTPDRVVPRVEPPLPKAAAGKIVAEYLGKVQGKFLAWEPLRQSFLSKLEHEMQSHATEMATKDAEVFKDAAKTVQREIYSVPTDGSFSKEDDKIFDAASSAADNVMMADVTLAVDMAVYAKTGLNSGDTVADIDDAKKAREAFQRAAVAAYQHFGITPTAVGPRTIRSKPVRK